MGLFKEEIDGNGIFFNVFVVLLRENMEGWRKEQRSGVGVSHFIVPH